MKLPCRVWQTQGGAQDLAGLAEDGLRWWATSGVLSTGVREVLELGKVGHQIQEAGSYPTHHESSPGLIAHGFHGIVGSRCAGRVLEGAPGSAPFVRGAPVDVTRDRALGLKSEALSCV